MNKTEYDYVYCGYGIDIFQGDEDWEQRYYYQVFNPQDECIRDGDDTFPKESDCLAEMENWIDQLLGSTETT